MLHSMGMIQVKGVTYRITCVGRNEYEVVRLLDDIRLGSFQKQRASIIYRPVAGEHSLPAIARFAVQQGKTKWKPAANGSRQRSAAGERLAAIASFLLESRNVGPQNDGGVAS